MKRVMQLSGLVLRQVRERVKQFLFDTDVDPCEIMSAAANWWCAWVLLIDPSYVISNQRLAPVLFIAPVWFWGIVMGAGAIYQTSVFLLGGPPHLLADTHARERFWLRARLYGHLIGVFVQSMVAILTDIKGVTIVAGLMAIFAAGNAWGTWRVYTMIGAAGIARWMRVVRSLTTRLSAAPGDALDKLDNLEGTNRRCG